MNKLVSILVPAYNSEKWIRQALKSASDQTWPRKEVIVVDDGSVDGTLEVARSFECKSVKVVHQENRGASAARNEALSLAQGDYIQWLDADDLLSIDKIEKQLDELGDSHNPGSLLSSAWGKFYFRPQKAKFAPSSLWQDLEPEEWMVRKFRDNSWMSIESWLVSRALTQMAGPWNVKLSMDDDGEYFARVVCCSQGIRFNGKARSYCRKGNLGSLSNSLQSEGSIASQLESLSLQIGYLRSLEESERTRGACLQYLESYISYLYPEKTAIPQKAEALASELGGTLSLPALNWKRDAAKRILGWRLMKKIGREVGVLRNVMHRSWDWFWYALSLGE